MLAPSSRPKQRHREREPRTHSTVAQRIAKARRARIQKITSANDLSHHEDKLIASLLKKEAASEPATPSTEKQKGVK